MTPKPTIIRNPANDREFEGAIEAALAEGVRDPRDLEIRLRARYPRVLVRPRELDAESIPMWYVYREGRWVRGT